MELLGARQLPVFLELSPAWPALSSSRLCSGLCSGLRSADLGDRVPAVEAEPGSVCPVPLVRQFGRQGKEGKPVCFKHKILLNTLFSCVNLKPQTSILVWAKHMISSVCSPEWTSVRTVLLWAEERDREGPCGAQATEAWPPSCGCGLLMVPAEPETGESQSPRASWSLSGREAAVSSRAQEGAEEPRAVQCGWRMAESGRALPLSWGGGGASRSQSQCPGRLQTSLAGPRGSGSPGWRRPCPAPSAARSPP